MPRYFAVEVERTVTYRRKVWVEVEETDERLTDEKRYGNLFADEASDAAVEKAKVLEGWEPHGQTEFRAVASRQVESAPNVDVIV